MLKEKLIEHLQQKIFYDDIKIETYYLKKMKQLIIRNKNRLIIIIIIKY